MNTGKHAKRIEELSKPGHPLGDEAPRTGDGWEYAWLVEKRGPDGALYLYAGEIGLFDWTADPNKALRFARQVDANAVAGGTLDDGRAVQHGWTTL